MPKKKTLRGVCYFYVESGTEGGYWAFMENKYISSRKNTYYKRLHVLKDGDQLTIFSTDNPSEMLWSGIISLRQYPPFTESAYCLWIRADQEGVDRKTWATYFIEEYPAELISVASKRRKR